MKQMFNNLKSNLNKAYFKAYVLGVTGVTTLGLSTVAHADTTGSSDVSTVTGSITSSLTSSKADFATALAAVVGVAIGFFILKFIVKQVVSYFAKVASKG